MPRTPLAVLALSFVLAGCGGGDDEGSSTPSFPEKNWSAEADTLLSGTDWYRHAVFYEIFVRSYQDSNGDGIGDFAGLTTRLDYLKELGIDAIWLMPIMPTAFKDSGYDVSDYTAINPDYGTMADFEAFLAAAHERKIRVVIDLVLNHTSDQHAWFQESRKDKTNPKADWYVWSDTPSHPDVPCGTENPTFGDSAWELDPTRGQYYFHRFYPEQPDLNYRNPEVVDATLAAARFWLDKGVDGFRCDVIALLYESAESCEFLDETKDYVKKLRMLSDEYPERVMVAEPTNLGDASAYFGSGSDMFHMAFHFGYGYFWGLHFNSHTSKSITATFESSLADYPAGAQDALVIGSHDVPRAFAAAQGEETRHRRAAMIQLAVKGSPYVYYGEELGLRPGTQKVVDSRDSARTPMLWNSDPGFGFTTGTPWLAFGALPESTNVAAEEADSASMLAFYKSALELRRGRAVWGTGEMRLIDVGNAAIFAALREDEFMAYVVGVNVSDEEPAQGSFERPADAKGVERVLGDGALAFDGSSATLELPAKAAGIFRIR